MSILPLTVSTMTNQHPITPPQEMVDQWVTEACPECRLTYDEFTGESVESLATKAARWGADQELEACCALLLQEGAWPWPEEVARLRDARRPKPPSLKEQALEALEVEDDAMPLRSLERGERFDLIRRALEALPND